MKIADPHCGLGQYSHYLGMGLAKHHADFDFRFMVEAKDRDYFPPDIKKIVPYSWQKKISTGLPKVDLWHAIHQDPDFLPPGDKTPLLLSIMDLNFLWEVADESKRKKLLARLQKRVDRAASLTTISHYSKSVMEENLKLHQKKVAVIYLGHAVNHLQKPVQPHFLNESRGNDFFFTIGVVTEKKNFLCLVEVMRAFPQYKLIIAGHDQTTYANKIREEINRYQLQDRVILAGKITEQEKIFCYQNCRAFLFPSLLEGFGLPVIEAMSFGRPVFCSDRCSLPEVTNGQAYLMKDFRADTIGELITHGLADYDYNLGKADQIRQQAKKFSWESTCLQYLTLYRQLSPST